MGSVASLCSNLTSNSARTEIGRRFDGGALNLGAACRAIKQMAFGSMDGAAAFRRNIAPQV
jgi:hypothetical protein